MVPYLAGIIDGEGTISIQTYKGNPYPVVSISNNCRELLDICAAIAGIKGVITKKKPKKRNHKLGYALTWRYNAALHVASLVAPFILVKKRQVEILSKWKTAVVRNGKYTSEQKSIRDSLVTTMKQLNGRGGN